MLDPNPKAGARLPRRPGPTSRQEIYSKAIPMNMSTGPVVMLAALLGLASTPVWAQKHVERRPALQLEIIDSIPVPGTDADGKPVKELSGIAWDEDEQLLYAVSDKGRIIHFKLTLDKGKVQQLVPLQSMRLKDESGTKLEKHAANAEGLAITNGANGIKGDTELLIVFESEPAIARFTPQGRRVGSLVVPAPLRSVENYSKPANGLESIAVHPLLGVLTAPEEPLAGQDTALHTVYRLEGPGITFQAHALGNGNIKALEVLSDGRLLVLERLNLKAEQRRVTAVRLVDPASCRPANTCLVFDLAPNSAALPDANFEGTARIPGDLFAAVSDDKMGEERRSLFVVYRLSVMGEHRD